MALEAGSYKRSDARRSTPSLSREDEEHWRCTNRVNIRCSPGRTGMSRSINKCHFLPRKPGVIAYAGEEIVWIVTITNTFRICFIFPTVFNRDLITSGVILPSGWLAVKETIITQVASGTIVGKPNREASR